MPFGSENQISLKPIKEQTPCDKFERENKYFGVAVSGWIRTKPLEYALKSLPLDHGRC